MSTRTLLLTLIATLFVLAPGTNGEVIHNLGISGVFPQMLALTYQVELARYFAMEGYVGSLAFLNATAGARAMLGYTGAGVKPRCFAGICVVDQYYAEYSTPQGIEFYLWTGAGLALEFSNGLQLFGDLVYIGNGDGDRGLGYSTGMSFSGGILFRL